MSAPPDTLAEARMALAGDAIADAARLIAVNALLGERGARRGDEAEALARLRAVSYALEEAREIYRIAGEMTR